MKNFTLVTFLLLGLVAVVLSTDVATFLSNFQSSSAPSTTSSGSTTGGRMVRASRDEKDDEKDDDDDKEKKSTARNSDSQRGSGDSGGSKALRIMRQHRTPSSSISSSSSTETPKDEKSDSSTTRKPRHERAAAKSVQVPRQTDPDGGPGAPGTQEEVPENLSTQQVSFTNPAGVPQQFTGRQAPQFHPTVIRDPPPPPPPPAGGASSSLTLPDGAELIVGQIKSGFTCASKIYGYYADMYNDCKLFHVCVPVGDGNGVTNPIQWSFVCGNQTLFNQEKLTCDYQENVDCSKSENFYSINENFGRPEDKHAVPSGAPAPGQFVPAPAPAPTAG